MGMPMRVSALLVPLLASLALSCSARHCDPPSKPFELDRTFTERDLQVARTGNEREDADCEALCEIVYALSTSESVDSIDSCTLMIEPEPPEDLDGPAGSIQCAGVALEYHCK